MEDRGLTVFLVDDDEDIRVALTRGLRKRGYEIEAYASAQDFLAGYDGARLGCLVLDHGMPGMTGLELQRHLNRIGAPLPIIFITGHGGVPESVQAIKGGAIDFLEKPFRQTVLVERIETAFELIADQVAKREDHAQIQAKFDRLTAREMEIVNRVIEKPSETSSKEVGAYLGISPRTVDHHRARILEKLQVKSVTELLALAQKWRGDSAG